LTDFFQSPSDKLRLEMMLKSLSAGDLNLAILGDDEVALAFYARKIYEHLKAEPNAQVDLCLSADAEKLVQRFNQILSELTLDEALDKSLKTPQKRFLIFPDTQFIQDFELQLLARLINGLPASNLFVVLIFNKREPYEKKLQSFGKNLVQWVLESEHPSQEQNFSHAKEWGQDRQEEVMSARDFKARQKAFLGAEGGDDFLNQSPLGDKQLEANLQSHGHEYDHDQDLGRIDPVLTPEELMAAVKSVQDQLDQESLALEAADEASQPSSSKTSWLGWGLLFGLLVSMGVLGAVYKDKIALEIDHMKEYLEGPKWEKKAQEKPSAEGSSASTLATGENPSRDGAVDASTSTVEGEPTLPEAQDNGKEKGKDKQPSVGMSSTTKLPIKLDDSLIPDKEAVLSAQEMKDKAKLQSRDRLETLSNAPAASSSPPSSPSSSSSSPSLKLADKPDLKAPPSLSSNKPAIKEEPLKIPILKDPMPLGPSSGVGSKSALKESAKDPAKEPVKEPVKEVKEVKVAKGNPKPSDAESGPKSSSTVPKSDVDWVNALPEKSWVLQLAAMPSKADLKALQASQPAFEGARILFTKNPTSGKTYFILIKGPISSKEEAQSLMTAGSGLSGAWLRSSKSLQTQFKGN